MQACCSDAVLRKKKKTESLPGLELLCSNRQQPAFLETPRQWLECRGGSRKEGDLSSSTLSFAIAGMSNSAESLRTSPRTFPAGQQRKAKTGRQKRGTQYREAFIHQARRQLSRGMEHVLRVFGRSPRKNCKHDPDDQT